MREQRPGLSGARKEASGEKQGEGRVAEEDLGHTCGGGDTDLEGDGQQGRRRRHVWEGLPLAGLLNSLSLC